MNAIQRFQVQNGLTPDGVVGKKTAQKMLDLWKLYPIQLAHFLGHGEIESGNWKKDRENMNYSAEGLMKTFGKYFPTKQIAQQYANNPEKIANYVYGDANRDEAHKLGNTQKGDGNKFRGGACGITGRNNYLAFAKYVKDMSIMDNPDLIWQKYFFESFLWFFKERNIWQLCTDVSLEAIKNTTKKVNGGYIGLKERQVAINKYYNLIK